MRIEHIALNVEEPVEVAAWYCANLGFTVKRRIAGAPRTHFLADEGGQTILEIYGNSSAPVPDYRSQAPLVFHIAFVCPDVSGTVKRLLEAGARLESAPAQVGLDVLAMLRDPWGVCIQLACRTTPMLV